MKKIFYLLLMLVVFQSVAYAADSWKFKSVKSNIAGTESLAYQDGLLTKYTTELHSGTVTVTLTVMGSYEPYLHYVRVSENSGTSWTNIDYVKEREVLVYDISQGGWIVAGWNFDYEIETVAGTNYYVQVLSLPNNLQEDRLIIYAKDPVANVFEMEEGDERGEWPETEVVRAYCPPNSEIISGYCKIWDEDELEEVPSYNEGSIDLNSDYYECRNPYSIGEDRYTRAYAECYQ